MVVYCRCVRVQRVYNIQYLQREWEMVGEGKRVAWSFEDDFRITHAQRQAGHLTLFVKVPCLAPSIGKWSSGKWSSGKWSSGK